MGGELVRPSFESFNSNMVYSVIQTGLSPDGTQHGNPEFVEDEVIYFAVKKKCDVSKNGLYFFKIYKQEIYLLGKNNDASPVFIDTIADSFIGVDQRGKVYIYDLLSAEQLGLQ